MEDLTTLSAAVAARLVAAKQTVAVAESSAGGLISASLLAVPGASGFYLGGGVIYTAAARNALLSDPGDALDGVRSASEPYALWLARTMREQLGSDWGIAETGAAGPSGNRYGDAPGHSCVAVAGPHENVITIATGKADRQANMHAFAKAALALLERALGESD